MKIINQTLYRTDQLKAILQRAAEIELEPAKRKRLVVTVSYTRGGHSSGCAWIGGRHATVRIRHPRSRSWKAKHDEPQSELVVRFASVAVHEFAHIRGADHAVMSDRYKWHGRWREYVQWAESMPLEVKPVKSIVKPSVDDKLAHVRKMLKVAESRAKRAATLLKKWKRKAAYFEKKQAAQRADV